MIARMGQPFAHSWRDGAGKPAHEADSSYIQEEQYYQSARAARPVTTAWFLVPEGARFHSPPRRAVYSKLRASCAVLASALATRAETVAKSYVSLLDIVTRRSTM